MTPMKQHPPLLPAALRLSEGLGRRFRSARTPARGCWHADTGGNAPRLVWGKAESARSLGGAAVTGGKPLGGLLGRR